MYTRKCLATGVVAAVALLGGIGPSQTAAAQQLTFEFRNPAFGGNYLNYQWMMSSAEAQNDYKDRGQSINYTRDPLADFQQSLQRQILSQLSRELIYERFGNLDLTKEGRFDLGEFVVEIIPGLDGVNIHIFNALTGDESTVTIPSY